VSYFTANAARLALVVVHAENDDMSTNLILMKSQLLALSDSDAQHQILTKALVLCL